MVSTVQEDTAWVDQETAEEQQQHFETLLAAVHKVTVEDVRVLGGGQSVLAPQDGRGGGGIN